MILHAEGTAGARLSSGHRVALAHEVVENHMGQDQEHGLVFEAVHVLLRVRVDALQRLEQLVVQTLQEGEDVAPHLLRVLPLRRLRASNKLISPNQRFLRFGLMFPAYNRESSTAGKQSCHVEQVRFVV